MMPRCFIITSEDENEWKTQCSYSLLDLSRNGQFPKWKISNRKAFMLWIYVLSSQLNNEFYDFIEKLLSDMDSRGGSRTAAISKVELFMIIVNG